MFDDGIVFFIFQNISIFNNFKEWNNFCHISYIYVCMKYVCSSSGEFFKIQLQEHQITGWSFNREKICHQNYFSIFILVLQIFKKFCQLVIFFQRNANAGIKLFSTKISLPSMHHNSNVFGVSELKSWNLSTHSLGRLVHQEPFIHKIFEVKICWDYAIVNRLRDTNAMRVCLFGHTTYFQLWVISIKVRGGMFNVFS